MYSAEVLSQLRSLNWLTQEIRRVPSDSRESALLQTQIDAVRDRLPDVILDHHDQLARNRESTAAEMVGGACGGCHARLPVTLIAEVSLPGRFNVCPNCGLFLWASLPPSPGPRMEGAKRAAKGASH